MWPCHKVQIFQRSHSLPGLPSPPTHQPGSGEEHVDSGTSSGLTAVPPIVPSPSMFSGVSSYAGVANLRRDRFLLGPATDLPHLLLERLGPPTTIERFFDKRFTLKGFRLLCPPKVKRGIQRGRTHERETDATRISYVYVRTMLNTVEPKVTWWLRKCFFPNAVSLS